LYLLGPDVSAWIQHHPHAILAWFAIKRHPLLTWLVQDSGLWDEDPDTMRCMRAYLCQWALLDACSLYDQIPLHVGTGTCLAEIFAMCDGTPSDLHHLYGEELTGRILTSALARWAKLGWHPVRTLTPPRLQESAKVVLAYVCRIARTLFDQMECRSEEMAEFMEACRT